jgi:hypothetical protein
VTEPSIPGLGVEIEVPEHLRDHISTCRSCGAAIIWAMTGKGRTMPVDARPDPKGNVAVVIDGDTRRAIVGVTPESIGPRHLSHFVTCRDAPKWRKKR